MMRFVTCAICVLFVSSCGDNQTIEPSYNPKTFSEVFDTFWAKMNSNYVFWDVEKTSWDEQYNLYKPLFDKLDLNNRDDDETALKYFTAMTNELIDGHYYIQFSEKYFGSTRVINPAITRKQRSEQYRPPYNYSKTVKAYLDNGYHEATAVGPDSQNPRLEILSGTIDERILYLSFNACYLYRTHTTLQSSDFALVIDYFFNKLNSTKTFRGVIIDVRGNSGGDLSDLNFVVGAFVNDRTDFGYARYKYDAGRFDLTPWVGAKINPLPGSVNTNVPLVVLADNFSASVAEIMTSAIQSLPRGTFVGENTYGATGVLAPQGLYNDGSFTVGDFMTVRTASSQFRTIDKQMVEGTGLSPDMAIRFDLGELNNGKDKMLEKAIQLLQ